MKRESSNKGMQAPKPVFTKKAKDEGKKDSDNGDEEDELSDQDEEEVDEFRDVQDKVIG